MRLCRLHDGFNGDSITLIFAISETIENNIRIHDTATDLHGFGVKKDSPPNDIATFRAAPLDGLKEIYAILLFDNFRRRLLQVADVV